MIQNAERAVGVVRRGSDIEAEAVQADPPPAPPHRDIVSRGSIAIAFVFLFMLVQLSNVLLGLIIKAADARE